MSRREEEIIRIADENYSGYSERRLGFIAGANWADEHPKEGLVNPDACDMNWFPIDRDENGSATEECLDRIFNNLPVLVRHTQMGGGYDVLNPKNERLKQWFRDNLKSNQAYTHYLPIPRLL